MDPSTADARAQSNILHALKQLLSLSRSGSISPLFCIMAQLVLVVGCPIAEVNMIISGLVVTITCTAIKVACDTCKCSKMSSSWEVTDDEDNCTTCSMSIHVICSS